MSMEIDRKLTEMGLSLPDAPAPAANYVPYVTTGNLVFVSGQISQDANGLIQGKLGADMATPGDEGLRMTDVMPDRSTMRSACHFVVWYAVPSCDTPLALSSTKRCTSAARAISATRSTPWR